MNQEPLPEQGPVDVNVRALIDALGNLARRGHYYCEDSWYSCPKAEDGCANENAGTECNCGADEHNAKVEEINAKLYTALCPNADVTGLAPEQENDK